MAQVGVEPDCPAPRSEEQHLRRGVRIVGAADNVEDEAATCSMSSETLERERVSE